MIGPPNRRIYYKSTVLLSPTKPLIPLKQTLSEKTQPVFRHDIIGHLDNDLTRNSITTGLEPLGERIVVSGRVMDGMGRPQPNTIIEIWQCRRYIHSSDQHNAPIDPIFFGGGRCITDTEGSYKFHTIKPAAYLWENHTNGNIIMHNEQTPSQTIGPFFAYGLTPKQSGYTALSSIASHFLADKNTLGEKIRIEGQTFDGADRTVPDAIIEIWQADAEGRYSNLYFEGFGRCDTGVDPDHKFIFNTIKPGSIGNHHAPHLNLTIFMRGMLLHVSTRLYFPVESVANSIDPILLTAPNNRRCTLIAQSERKEKTPTFVFNIYIQGNNKTVFFDT